VFASAIPRIACVLHSTSANWHREGGNERGREGQRERGYMIHVSVGTLQHTATHCNT